MRALDLACLPLGDMRIHSSSRSRVFDSCAFGFFFILQAVLLLLQPGGIVALPGNALAAVEFQNPAGHVVEKIAVMGHGDDRCLHIFAGDVPARRRIRRPDGWSVRPASRMSGFCKSRRHRATRRFSPPERTLTGVSPGGQRRASIAISSRESMSQASSASIFS